MKKHFIINILFFTTLCYSQLQNPKPLKINYEFNFSIESSILYSTKNYTNIEKEESFSDIYPISLYFSGLIYFYDNLAFEFKPGLVFGGEYYTGLEYGFYLRYYIDDQRYYASFGFNIHDNGGVGHGTAISVTSTDESINYLALKIAYKPKTYFAFTLGYYHPLEDYPYFSISDVFGDSYIGNLNNIVKLGFEFSF